MNLFRACERDRKPSSVEDDHLSRSGVAAQTQAISGTQRAADRSHQSCTGWGLQRGRVARPRVSSYLAFPSLLKTVHFFPGFSGLFLLHFPWSCLHRLLAGTLPCGARTFLLPCGKRSSVHLACLFIIAFWPWDVKLAKQAGGVYNTVADI